LYVYTYFVPSNYYKIVIFRPTTKSQEVQEIFGSVVGGSRLSFFFVSPSTEGAKKMKKKMEKEATIPVFLRNIYIPYHHSPFAAHKMQALMGANE
jgi:hypothetical protein